MKLEKFYRKIVNHPKLVLIVFGMLFVLCAVDRRRGSVCAGKRYPGVRGKILSGRVVSGRRGRKRFCSCSDRDFRHGDADEGSNGQYYRTYPECFFRDQ